MRRLTDLNPQWMGVLRPGPASGEGVTFDCPTCGPKHRVFAYFTNPLDEGAANTWNAHWTRHGDTFDALTLAPSMAYPCWHGWVEYGLVFGIEESPLALPGAMVGEPQHPLVALSPDQAEKFARALLERVAQLRGGA